MSRLLKSDFEEASDATSTLVLRRTRRDSDLTAEMSEIGANHRSKKMVEARPRIDSAVFEAVSRELAGRARSGRGRVSAVPSVDAEDVVQDAWEKLVRQGKLPPGRHLNAHAHEALVDASRNYWRSRRRKKDVPPRQLIQLDDAPEDQLASGESEERKVAALATREIVDALANVLDAEAQSYVVLDALGLEEKEIAITLGVSAREAGAARKRVNRNRSAIAETINHPTTTKEDQ
jgi:RNA polymerase sigma factor (sigma-70 family)